MFSFFYTFPNYKKTYFLKKDANSDVNVTANILSIRMKPYFTHL